MSNIQCYKAKDGKRLYKFQIYIGTDPLTGKRKKTTRSGFKTKKEAQLELSRIQLEIFKGTFTKQAAETYQDVFKLWIVQYEKSVQESTFVKTTGLFKNHILPSLGHYRISNINVDVCQKHVNEWFNRLQKFRTVKAYSSKVLDFAMKRGLIQSNPMKLVETPIRLEQPDDDGLENFYTREQLLTFLKCLEKENNYKAYVFFRLLAYSGMRKGEALALTWNDINFKDSEIRINKALSRGKDNQLYVKTTKNKKARTIKMDNSTMDILRNWRKKQEQDYLVLGYSTTSLKQLVFSNEVNSFLQPTKTRKWIIYVQKKYNLDKITTHGLRHTHCSLLFEAGATIPEVQERLGHDDVQTTMNIYTHVTNKAKENAILKFVNYLDDSNEETTE
ncbi:tyrosine-type recombinase/integrase [Lysinibacillus sp. SGAir0095]|uniref:site-specific integrase n=1 Tax=Lysinibacillus sp. SGAir0095 TaxID=2070463 RepID=UPI0010CD5D25|nr:tyrosine-type recombinase/integrase [Lysinibacillus sp. SGAir0095]QCR33588.1 site-specific integrase [Lysinibacillus sp. SGAir0095]